MLGNLFKPRWQHRDPAVRALAVAELDPTRDADTLGRLARDDDSAMVRARASATLLDLTLLDALIHGDADGAVREAASLRIMALLAGTVENAPPIATRLHLISHTDNQQVLHHVARHSPAAECRQAALAAIGDAPTLFELAVSGKDETLRLAAAERLDDDTLLRQLSREGRDKRVIRLARERLKARQNEQHQRQQHREQVIQIADALNQLAQRSADPLFAARFQQLEQRWRERREHAEADVAQRASGAIERCRARLAEHAEAERRDAARQSARHEQAQALHTLTTLLHDTDTLTWDEQLGTLRSLVDTQERRWQAAVEEHPATADQQAKFQARLQYWRQLIGLADAASDSNDDAQRRELASRWPSGVARPSTLNLAPENMASENTPEPDRGTTTAPAAGRKQPRRVSRHRGLVVALRRELQRGNLKHANRLWHKADQVLEEEQDDWLIAQLERLRPRREELRDWHAFAAQPKKEQICERMEALADATLDAAELATAIQALHDEWRELMSSDQDQDQALWERFKSASDRAYQPCRAHFAELDMQRAENLRRRQALCEQLAGFIEAQDWARADWQAVWEIRRQAPREWKALIPVRFTDARDLQKRFSALLSSLDQRLDDAWQQAEQTRLDLIEQGRALADSDDVHGAARAAQTLQQAWRDAPWLPPARHRSHQKTFRRLVDGLFAARQAAFDNRQEQRREALEDIRARLDEMEAALARPPAEQDERQLARWANELGSVDLAPLGQDARKRGRRLLERLRRSAIELPRWRRWQAAHERLTQAPSGAGTTADATLAVAMEALAGVDSPESARAERLAWQLEQLPRAMKSSEFQPLNEALALIERRPPDAALDPALADRLTHALAALEPQSGGA
jgi:hypothetical protein